MAECFACARHDSRAFYCPSCVTTRLGDHYARRKQYREAVQAAQARATGWLQGDGSVAFGVREERELKADKWALAVRLRDLRIAAEQTKVDVDAARQAVKSRQADLDKRRANLRRARQLLNDRRSSSPAMPHATATERTRQALIQRQHQAVQSRATDTRSILARELLAAYGFDQVHADQPLPSPFKSPTSSTSSLTSSISSSALDVLHISLPATGPTFTLGQVLLPPLSAFAALSPPHLSAVLSHILQLVRLLALYQDVALPFTPLPSLFGPGRPGVRAIPGHGEGVPSAAGPGLASWPLFLSRTSTRDSNEPSAIADYARVTGATATPPATQASGPQTGGRDTDLVAREAERRAVRLKAALTGAVALAYDLAWIAWTAGLALELKLEDLDNVGGLLSKISGLVGESGTAVEPRPRTISRARPPALSETFPIDFSAAVARYTSPRTSRQALATESESGEDEWDLV